MKTKLANPAQEQVGRTYERITYGVHSRLIGGDGCWYGRSNYSTLAEAQKHLDSLGGRYHDVGGIVLDLGKTKSRYEFRIVKSVAQIEVLQLETKAI